MSPRRRKKNSTRTVQRRIKQDWHVAVDPQLVYEFIAAGNVIVGSLLILSLNNVGGLLGQYLKSIAFAGLGIGAYFLVAILFLSALALLLPEDNKQKWSRKPAIVFGSIIVLLAIVGIAHLPMPRSTLHDAFTQAQLGKGGGVVGFFLTYPLQLFVGSVGSLIILVGLLIIGLQIASGFSWSRAISFLTQLFALPSPRKVKTTTVVKIAEKKVAVEEDIDDVKEEKVTNLKITRVEPTVAVSSKKAFEPVVQHKSSQWQLPPIDLLEPSVQSTSDYGDPHQKAKIIEDTLLSFGVPVKVVEANCGPTVTQYAVKPDTGVRVSKIMNLYNDLALALSAPTVRIEAPIPSRPYVGIEIPNSSVSVVRLRELIESQDFVQKARKSKLVLVLGRDVSGAPVLDGLEKMPHLLIAGATGSGKSVCSNAIICSLLYQATPDEVKFIMVDPKVVELSVYNGIPHLLSPVITEPIKTISALKWALKEMERRYQVLGDSGSRNIKIYNSNKKYEALPYIVIIIEELADLMMVSPIEVEGAITRLAQKARAVGIHLICSTQRPSTDVITGLIKANIPARIAFNVTSQVDSRVILDMPGAEKLLGQGDMLFLPPDAPRPQRVQGAFVSDKEIIRLIDFLKNQGKPEFTEEVLTQVTSMETNQSETEDLDDELLVDGLRLFLETGKASTSYLQRRLKIGYARAARIMDILEEKGLIGPGYPGSSKPRDVYLSKAREFLDTL